MIRDNLLAQQLGQEPFIWGCANLVDAGETHARYIEALRAADNHDIKLLLLFAILLTPQVYD